MKLNDATRGVTFCFAPGDEPSRAAIRPDHLEIKLVRGPTAQGFVYGTLLAFPAFCRVELRVFLIAGRWLIGIETGDPIKLFRPGHRRSEERRVGKECRSRW